MKVIENVIMLEATNREIRYQDKCISSMVYAVLETDGITLIDSGFPGFGLQILEELRSMGEERLPLKQILLTHADHDHMGTAAWLQQKTGCLVYISKTETEYLTGVRNRLPQKEVMCRDLGLTVPDRLTVYPKDNVLSDFLIIPTPGHTAGHVSILYKENVLFGGDLFVVKNGVFDKAIPQWSEDMDEVERSLARIKQFSFSMLCPAHWRPCKRKGNL